MKFRIPEERIAHETVDGEVVILDQVNGVYYSLAGGGAAVWSLLETPSSANAIAAALTQRYDDDGEALRVAVHAVIDELLREVLIVPAGPDDGAATIASANADGAPLQAWPPSKLEKFTDLQSLLLLDPIHEVDEAGWPRVARKVE